MKPFNPDLSAVIAESGLSAQELALVPAWQRGAVPCILESDAILKFSGQEMTLTLSVYGRHVRGFAGTRETPEERPMVDISAVTITAGGDEVDITLALDAESEEIIQLAIEGAGT